MTYLLTVLFMLIPMLASAATRYIDITAGADTNTSTQAQSKSTPWKHLPCMATATSNAASYVPVAGDIFVLKGGETWPNANFPCTWNWSGTAGNVITIGVDATWFTGGSWTRPIWTAGGATISAGHHAFLDTINGNSGVTYLTVDNVEITGFYWTGAPAFLDCAMLLVPYGNQVTLDHLYIHGWAHDTYANGTRDDSCYVILGNSGAPYNVGSVLQNSLISGSDSTNGGDSLYAAYLFPSLKNSVIRDTTNGWVTIGHGEISGNLLYNCKASFDAAPHTNQLEIVGSDGIWYIHDNYLHDGGACESVMIGNPGETAYVWNNVIITGTQTPVIDQAGAAGTSSQYWWNNTIIPPAGAFCVRRRPGGGLTYPNLYWQNNHCISTSANDLDTAFTAVTTTLVQTNNLLQTPAAATAQGYTNAQSPYTYYPTTGGSTIAAGVNLSANCTGSRVGLCSDTTYGSVVTGTTVTGAGRVAVSHPGIGVWDIGAYQFASASVLRSVGPTSQTGATLIWPASTLANFAGYHVYRSTTPGVYGAALATITPATAAATYSPITRYIARLPVAATYYFTVVPFDNVAVEGPGSAELTVVTTGLSARGVRQSTTTRTAPVTRSVITPRTEQP